MKNLLFILLLAGTGAQAQMSSDNAFIFGPVEPSRLDCEPYEHFTDWGVKYVGDSLKRCFEHKGNRINISHSWVYADHDDVNKSSGVLNMVYCPCGCPQFENQARICSECLRHETRVRSYGFHAVERKESEYVRLKKRIKE